MWPIDHKSSVLTTRPPSHTQNCHRRFWHASQDCVAPYIDHILHRDRFWVISIASGSVRLWDLSNGFAKKGIIEYHCWLWQRDSWVHCEVRIVSQWSCPSLFFCSLLSRTSRSVLSNETWTPHQTNDKVTGKVHHTPQESVSGCRLYCNYNSIIKCILL